MKTLFPLLAVCALACANMGGCASTGTDGGGIAGTGLHGELNAGTTVDPMNPTAPQINVGGKIYFLKPAALHALKDKSNITPMALVKAQHPLAACKKISPGSTEPAGSSYYEVKLCPQGQRFSKGQSAAMAWKNAAVALGLLVPKSGTIAADIGESP